MSEFEVINSEKIRAVTKDSVVNVVLHTLLTSKQVLVFNNSKSSSEKTAEIISEAIKKVENFDKLEDLSRKILKAVSVPTKQCRRLSKIVLKGVAFHHSGLVAKQRSLIEKAFKEGIVKVISSTPTLAAGLNLPAYKVIVKDYKRYSSRGFNDIPVLEFHQMSGRAGRPGKEEVGKAVLLVKSEDELSRVVPKYVFGKAEEIISKLAIEPILKMYLLSLVSMNMINTKDEIKAFFSNTLYAHQYRDLEGLNYNLFRILNVLKDYKFVDQQDDYYVATQLGKKVAELYLNPDTANYFYENLDKFIGRFNSENVSRYDVYSLLFFVVNTSEMKPYFSVSKIEEDSYVKKAQDVGDSLIVGFNPFEMDYENFLRLLKLSDLLFDWIGEAHEDYLLEKYRVTPGELNYKLETVDWLLYCLEEMVLMKKNFYFKNYIEKLRQRFKFGVKPELLSFVSLKGVGRVRARKLFNAGFKKVSDLEKADFASISRVVGDGIAVRIKSQVSDGVEFKDKVLKRPKEIEVRDVSDDEVEELLMSASLYEKEKEEKQRSLKNFF